MKEQISTGKGDTEQDVSVLDTTNVRKLRTVQSFDGVRKPANGCRLLQPLKIKVILELEQQKGMKTFMTGNNILDELSQGDRKPIVAFDTSSLKYENPNDKQCNGSATSDAENSEFSCDDSSESLKDNGTVSDVDSVEPSQICAPDIDQVGLRTKHDGFADFFKYFREQEILRELELTARNIKGSIYVFPSCESLQVWYGVLFVPEGLYSEGIFHFVMIFNDDYPYSRPVVRMYGKPFHPQVSDQGILNLETEFPCWDSGENHVWEILHVMYSFFTDIKVDNAVNAKAAHEFLNEREKFEAKARSYVLDSLLIYEEQRFMTLRGTEGVENPFLCRILHGDELRHAKTALASGSTDVQEIQNGSLVVWARNRLIQLLHNGSSQSFEGAMPDIVNF